MVVALIIVGLVVLFAAIAIGVSFATKTKIYNTLVERRNKVKNSWAHIDAQLQRRFDLIPNLVEIVRGVANQERQFLDGITSIVDKYMRAQSNSEKLEMDAQLSAQLSNLHTIIQNYPQLQSNRNFLQLQEALTEIEEDISYARQFYNDAVTIYNNELQKYPNNMIAQKYNFVEEPLFKAVQGADKAPKIYFKSHTQCPVCGAVSTDNEPNCKHCGCSLL